MNTSANSNKGYNENYIKALITSQSINPKSISWWPKPVVHFLTLVSWVNLVTPVQRWLSFASVNVQNVNLPTSELQK